MWNQLQTTIFGSNVFDATIDFGLETRLSNNWNCCAYDLTNFKKYCLQQQWSYHMQYIFIQNKSAKGVRGN